MGIFYKQGEATINFSKMKIINLSIDLLESFSFWFNNIEDEKIGEGSFGKVYLGFYQPSPSGT